jgi:hypothetical protein
MSLGQDGPPTRTRMPEGHGGHSGGARRAQPRRALVTVVSIIALLVAALAFANRGSHPSSSSSTDGSGAGSGASAGTGGSGDSGGAGSSGGKSGTDAATAPSGQKPVTGKAAGIPAGFPHSGEGAQSAAANYAIALGGEGMYSTARRHQIVDTVYAPGSTAKVQGDLDKVYSDASFLQRIGLKPDGTAPTGMTFISRVNPAGSRADKVSADTATVSVWYSSLFGLAGEGSTNPVAESWYTNTFEMKWVGNDWKILSFQQKDGPTPVGRDQAASSAQDMANAVNGFGGFTYAR